MALHATPFFPHRRNTDGSYDSICLNCFATIANAKSEVELTEYDNHHICARTVLSERENFRPPNPS
jgi:hypothetical protein